MTATPARWHIRQATAADAEALARFGAQCFREAYGADTREEDIEAHIAEHYGTAQQHAEIAEPEAAFLMAFVEGQLHGYARLRRSVPPEGVGPGDALEIHRFYLARQAQGSGLAQRLMRDVLDLAHSRGAKRIWLTVWERNARAIAFYRRWGFVDCGETVFPVGDDPQIDRLMAIDLPAPSPERPA